MYLGTLYEWEGIDHIAGRRLINSGLPLLKIIYKVTNRALYWLTDPYLP